MKIWVDADAVPLLSKRYFFVLLSVRKRLPHWLRITRCEYSSKFISRLQVSSGFDIADNEIVKRIEPNDLVITGDIPLAAEVIEKGAQALNPRGELYTTENIRPV